MKDPEFLRDPAPGGPAEAVAVRRLQRRVRAVRGDLRRASPCPRTCPTRSSSRAARSAVENALKAAFDWKVAAQPRARAWPARRGSRSSTSARPSTAAAATPCRSPTPIPRKTDLFPKFHWPRVDNPKLRFPVTPEVERDVARGRAARARADREGLRRQPGRHRRHPHRAHPGRGRRQPLPARVPAGAGAHGATSTTCFFIVDEVQTGIGITGKMWAHEHFGLQPGRPGLRQEDPGLRLPRRAQGGRGAGERLQGRPRASTRPGAAASPTWCAPRASSRSSQEDAPGRERARGRATTCSRGLRALQAELGGAHEQRARAAG